MAIMIWLNAMAAGIGMLSGLAMLPTARNSGGTGSRRSWLQSPTIPLAILMWVASYILLVMTAYQGEWIVEAPWMIGTQTPLIFLPGPVLLWYALTTVEPSFRLRWRHLTHLVPTALYVAWLWPVFSAPSSTKVQTVLSSYYASSPSFEATQFWHMLLGLTHFSLYLALAARRFQAARTWTATARSLLGFSALVVLVFVVRAAIAHWTSASSYVTAVWAHTAIALWILSLAFIALRQSPAWFPATPATAKYEKAGMNARQCQQVAAEVEDLVRRPDTFARPDLTLQHIADVTGYTRHQISQALNQGLEKSFNRLLTDIRLHAVISRLDDGDGRSLEIIAHEAGFSSRSGFHSAFKRLTGLSPGVYRARLSNPVGKDIA